MKQALQIMCKSKLLHCLATGDFGLKTRGSRVIEGKSKESIPNTITLTPLDCSRAEGFGKDC